MSDDGGIGMLMIGLVLGGVVIASGSEVIWAENVATQICQFLDTDLIEYEIENHEFKYIKCGDPKLLEPKLIEGLDAEKLIEVLQ